MSDIIVIVLVAIFEAVSLTSLWRMCHRKFHYHHFRDGSAFTDPAARASRAHLFIAAGHVEAQHMAMTRIFADR